MLNFGVHRMLFMCLIHESMQRAVILESSQFGSTQKPVLKNQKNVNIQQADCSKPDIRPSLVDPLDPTSPIPNGGLITFHNTTSTDASHLFLEYPADPSDFRYVTTAAHAICRQLGYMTYKAVEERALEHQSEAVHPRNVRARAAALRSESRCLRPGSFECDGSEQSVHRCRWKDVVTGPCRRAVHLTCGDCGDTFEGTTEGVIQSPGYPLVHIYDVSCHWTVRAPEDHKIYLRLRHSSPYADEDGSNTECLNDKPYVEITYGLQNEFQIYRYCNFSHLPDFSIPFNSVQIRFFSGVHSPNSIQRRESVNQGLLVEYAAYHINPYNNVVWIAVAVPVALIFIGMGVFGCYVILKLKQVDGQGANVPNAPTLEDLNRAYEFEHCKVKKNVEVQGGLRLRSSGGVPSWSKLPSVIVTSTTTLPHELPTTRNMTSETTPRNFLPDLMQEEQVSENTAKYRMITHLKANLLDRFRADSGSQAAPSHTYCSENSDAVFLSTTAAGRTFTIYRSPSGDYVLPKTDI